MKRICEDYIDYGREKDISDYILDVENNTLLIHTLCIIKIGRASCRERV